MQRGDRIVKTFLTANERKEIAKVSIDRGVSIEAVVYDALYKEVFGGLYGSSSVEIKSDGLN